MREFYFTTWLVDNWLVRKTFIWYNVSEIGIIEINRLQNPLKGGEQNESFAYDSLDTGYNRRPQLAAYWFV